MADKKSSTKIIEIEQLLQKKIILYTSNNFRHEGTIIDYGSIFITLVDTNNKTHLINVQTIDRIEIKE
jgi:hypothetical protein